jgi:hypothetical protein
MKVIKMSGVLLAAMCALSLAMSAAAKDKLPETTTDGLVLQKGTKMRAVYVKPGASLAGYSKIGLLDCYVAFTKNWQRDQNDDAIDLSRKVSTEDMDKIKTKLAAEFRTVFTKELQEKGGYAMTDKGGEDVLILRPAIVNLDVNAPDLDSPGMTREIVASAGEMTLYMEIFDGATGDIIARVIDPEADNRGGFAMAANSVTNKAAADRIIRAWADTLRKALDEVKGQTRPADATNTTPTPGAKPAADAAPAADKPKN